jgi:deoxyribonuclease-4
MPRSIKLKMPAPTEPPKLTSRRIGIHTSTSGGPETAAERAYRLGCNTFQIFSSSPRMWRPYAIAASQCEAMSALRAAGRVHVPSTPPSGSELVSACSSGDFIVVVAQLSDRFEEVDEPSL